MSIKSTILRKLQTAKHQRTRTRLALELRVSDATVRPWISEGSDSLTKAAALRIISEELKEPIESIITTKK